MAIRMNRALVGCLFSFLWPTYSDMGSQALSRCHLPQEKSDPLPLPIPRGQFVLGAEFDDQGMIQVLWGMDTQRDLMVGHRWQEVS
jgi:hypothetical protein